MRCYPQVNGTFLRLMEHFCGAIHRKRNIILDVPVTAKVFHLKQDLASHQTVRPSHEIPSGLLQITMSHALTSAAQSLSLSEKRVMMFAVAKLDVFKADGGISDGRIKLTAHEYATLFNVDSDTAYTQLKSASDALFERSIQWFEKGPYGGVSERIRWVSSAKYNKGAGSVTLRFTPEVRPHLVGLRMKFTTYKLVQASSLRSLYSWRLLELLSQNKALEFRQISLDEFHHAMETPIGYKANFKILRQRVIEPAVKELCAKDGWMINWVAIKTGRKVTGLRFEYKRTMQGALSL